MQLCRLITIPCGKHLNFYWSNLKMWSVITIVSTIYRVIYSLYPVCWQQTQTYGNVATHITTAAVAATKFIYISKQIEEKKTKFNFRCCCCQELCLCSCCSNVNYAYYERAPTSIKYIHTERLCTLLYTYALRSRYSRVRTHIVIIRFQ